MLTQKLKKGIILKPNKASGFVGRKQNIVGDGKTNNF